MAEIALKLFKFVGSEPFFFNIGVLREDGKEPEINKRGVCDINEPREGSESLTRLVGRGAFRPDPEAASSFHSLCKKHLF